MNTSIGKGIGTQGRNRLSKVLASSPETVNAKLVAETLNISTKQANQLLFQWNKSGWLTRIRRGTYIPLSSNTLQASEIIENPLLVANNLFGPGYIGGFSAIKYWDLSEQIIETTYFFTTKKVRIRTPTYGNSTFKIKTISDYRMFGLKSVWINNKNIRISDPTKTMVDILDDPKLVGGMTMVFEIFEAYLSSSYQNLDLLIEYANKMNNNTILKRLGFMLETKLSDPPKQIRLINQNLSKAYSTFDPTQANQSIVNKWRLKVPTTWKANYDRKIRNQSDC